MKIVYLFDENTGAYIGPYECHESPLEPGEFLEPVHSVPFGPDLVAGLWPVLVNGAWVNVEDHRGVVYDITSGDSVHHDAIGPLPVNLTGTPKPSGSVIWNGSAWVPDYVAVRSARVLLLRMACEHQIIGGVDHDALGAIHHYPSSREDQSFMNARFSKAQALGVGGEPYKFMCADGNGNWARRDHTAAQIIAVALAVESHVTDALNRLDSRLASVALAADDLAAIEAVIW